MINPGFYLAGEGDLFIDTLIPLCPPSPGGKGEEKGVPAERDASSLKIKKVFKRGETPLFNIPPSPIKTS